MDVMKLRNSQTARLFAVEAAYAESIFRDAIGDTAASLAALREALTLKPVYAPAILSMRSVEYQRNAGPEEAFVFLFAVVARRYRRPLRDHR